MFELRFSEIPKHNNNKQFMYSKVDFKLGYQYQGHKKSKQLCLNII